MEFPTLYAQPATGNKIKMWKQEVIDMNTYAIIRRTHGYKGFKLTQSERKVEKGKNIGRTNETTYIQQAISEAQSIFKKQKDAGYNENINSQTPTLLLPMLALDFHKRHKSIESAFALQPKLDGIRLVCTSNCMYSRTGKQIDTVVHITNELRQLFQTIPYTHIDGEFYSHDFTFEEISGLFRKKKLSASDSLKLSQIKFHIFDVFSKDNSDSFHKRYTILESALQNMHCESIQLVPTQFFVNHDSTSIVQEYHNIYIRQGFEGVIIRNSNSPYAISHRSKDLQKYKEFKDEEYVIVGGEEATGNDSGTVIFICKTPSGQQFHVRPRGSREIRKHWFDSINSYCGKKLTVRFQEYSEYGIPRFPVGIEVRDYE